MTLTIQSAPNVRAHEVKRRRDGKAMLYHGEAE